MRLTRILVLGSILYGFLVCGLFARNGDLLAMMLPPLVYLFFGFLRQPDKVRLQATRTLSADRVTQGSSVTVRLEVTNLGSNLEEVFFSELGPMSVEPVSGTTDLITPLRAGESVHWEYTLRASRGYYRFQGLQVQACEYFGLFMKQETLPAANRLIVLPSSEKLKRVTIRPRRTKVYAGLIPARSGGRGVEFFGVREYQPGDSPRLINWKAMARHPPLLYTNEFEQERVADVGLILDARSRSYADSSRESLFEHAVSAAAALAEALLNDGNRVGLCIYGHVLNWTFPGYGKMQKERVLQALAKAETGVHLTFEKLEHLHTRLFPARSQLIFISPLQPDDKETLAQLQARGYEVMVVSPNPIRFQEEDLAHDPDRQLGKRVALLEREILLRRLRRSGIHILDWPIHESFHQTVNAATRRQGLWPRQV